MGMLYDLASRIPDRFDIDDAERPTPSLNIHRAFYHHDHPGDSGLPTSYAEAFWNRSEINLIAGVDRQEMLHVVNLVATNLATAACWLRRAG